MKNKNFSLQNFVLTILILLAANPVPAARPVFQTQPAAQDTLGLKILKPLAGDRCIVCDKPLEGEGLVVLYRGRRVPIFNGAMLAEFIKNPAKYFPRLQPAGALFQESRSQINGMQLGWFFFGLWIVVALISAAMSANLALRKGLSAIRWFFTGLALSVIGLILVWQQKPQGKVALPAGFAKIPATAAPVRCPDCATQNHPSAHTCSGCGGILMPESESDVARIGT